MALLSRIGRRPIPLPQGVKVQIKEGKILVEGPKGRLEKPLPPMVEVEITDGEVRVKPQEVRKKLQRKAKAFQGLTRALINNMVLGVSQGFTRSLDIIGLGYRAELKGNEIVFHLGYSHPINFKLPEGITLYDDPPTVLNVPVNVGDVIIFTPILRHGARAWTEKYPRYTCRAYSSDEWPQSTC